MSSDWFFEQFQPAAAPAPESRAGLWMQLVAVATVAGVAAAGLALPGVGVSGAVALAGVGHWESLPTHLPSEPLPQRSVITDADGAVIAEFFSENRVPVRLADVAPVLGDAVLAVEDDRFYRHGALDSRGFGRAAVSAGAAGGGSTITQQYVKNVLLNAAATPAARREATEPTVARKAAELRYAAEAERTMTKQEILEGYLNIANFGDGTYGVGAAAQHYFSRPASELDLAQAATLAGILRNPSRYNPVRHPDEARARRDVVLSRMEVTGRASAADVAAAKAAPLTLTVSAPANGCGESQYPFYCAMVRNIVATDPAFGATPESRAALLYTGGLTIRTHLRRPAADAAAAATAAAMGPRNEYAAAAAVVEPGTGRILGVGQSRTWQQTQVNLATSGFQNGSTFKPLTLAAALENGWTADRVLTAQERYCPPKPATTCVENAAGWDAGPMTAADAMAVSSNTWFTELSVATGVEHTQDMARRLGWRLPATATGREASTTLGVYDVSPVTVANAYATFAAHGRYCTPTAIASVTGPGGRELAVPQADCHAEMSPSVADTVAATLTGVIDGPNEHRTGKGLSIGRPVAGKSGTTQGSTAVWFAGATPQASVAVWVGDPAGGFANPVRNLRLYGRTVASAAGATGAGPIWKDVMSRVSAGTPVVGFTAPAPSTGARESIPDVVGQPVASAAAAVAAAGWTPVLVDDTAGSGPPGVVSAAAPGPRGRVQLTLTPGSDTSVALVGGGDG